MTGDLMAPGLDHWISRLTAVAAILLLALTASGCAPSTTTPAAPPPPVARPAEPTLSVAIVGTGQSQFAVDEPSAQPGRTLDEVLRWYPYGGMLRPLAGVLHRAVNRYFHTDRGRTIDPALPTPPSSIVEQAMARSLRASGRFTEVRVLDGEPTGDGQPADMIVRVTVPTWGVMRVRSGDPDLVSGFVDARALMVARSTGVVVWETEEDVTAPQRLPLESLTRDRDLARQELVGVLERAGHRLASELLYSRSGEL